LYFSVACLSALQRHGECLALINKRLEEDTGSPDLFIMRARLHELFRNVSVSICVLNIGGESKEMLKTINICLRRWWAGGGQLKRLFYRV
jgi:hypothetical protein